MSDAATRAVNGAALAPLSAEQKTRLVLLAREAFTRLTETGVLGDAAEFGPWRHEQCQQAVERPGLTACRQEDYLPLQAHFLGLLGRKAAAEVSLQRAWDDPRRQAFAKLRSECQAAADVMPAAWNYAAGFCQNKRKVGIDDADAKTIWQAVFLIRRRAGQLRRKEAGNAERGTGNSKTAGAK